MIFSILGICVLLIAVILIIFNVDNLVHDKAKLKEFTALGYDDIIKLYKKQIKFAYIQLIISAVITAIIVILLFLI